MGRKKKRIWRITAGLKEETKYSVLAIIFLVLGIFFVLAALDKAGPVGGFTYGILERLLGVGFFLLPLVMLILGFSFLRNIKPELVIAKVIGAIFLFLSGLGLVSTLFGEGSGGSLGALFDMVAATIFLSAIFLISILLVFDTKLIFKRPSFTIWRRRESDDYDIEIDEDEEYEEDDYEEDENKEELEEKLSTQEGRKGIFGIGKKKSDEEIDIREIGTGTWGVYSPPPLSILARDSGKPGVGDIKANANIIKRTFQNFGISVEMDEISVGPTVTRYALKPAEGIKLSRIVGLQNDLGLALAAHPIRIEAPIPGKSLVGIEVPNTAKTTVGLAGLLGSSEFIESEKPLLFALGKGVSGKHSFADLTRLPHLLIAGSTGSGKSVTIHAVISSLLYRNSPENLRFIMIDPKRVELTLYNNIPHLLTPVVTDPKKAILSLKWAAKEMERRYDILESERARDIASYHKNVVAPAYKKHKGKDGADLPPAMPYIVIVLDELADIMTSYPRELESAIVRLAQMSRATGIHLVLSTQRPSVNIITGLIKANIPARIALQMTSQVDSRTVLDASGAEKLLGSGDMLYMSGEMSQPRRIQSAFVSEDEVKKIVKHLSKQEAPEAEEELNLTTDSDKDTLFDAMNGSAISVDDDELYDDAYDTVVAAEKASTSYLQRKLKVGYSRAARLMDMLEERGVIGPQDGSKPREVLVEDDGELEDGFENNSEGHEEESEEEEK